MTARGAVAVLAVLAAFAALVCVPFAVFLGIAALLVAIGWEWDEQRAGDSRRRNHAHRAVRR